MGYQESSGQAFAIVEQVSDELARLGLSSSITDSGPLECSDGLNRLTGDYQREYFVEAELGSAERYPDVARVLARVVPNAKESGGSQEKFARIRGEDEAATYVIRFLRPDSPAIGFGALTRCGPNA